MSVQRESSSASTASPAETDLESTAELPVLDVEAYEAAAEARSESPDAWIVPSPVTPAEPPPQPRQRTPELAPTAAAVPEAPEARVAELQRMLQEREALATSYLESLRSIEGRRSLFESLATSLHWEAEDRAARVTVVEGQLAAAAARAEQLQAAVSDRDLRIAGLEKQVADLNTTLSQRDATLRASAGERQSELDRVLAERAALTASVTSLESKLAQASAGIAELEAVSSEAQSRGEELDASNVQLRRRIDQLEAELVTVRAELQQRSVALEEAAVARGEHMARIAAEEAHVHELQGRIQEQHEFVRVLQADSNASVARVKELEGDLRAAEDMIHRLEGDLRKRSARLDELEKTHQEWRVTVEEARTALTDRDSLIRRLEEESANSAVLLGAIQEHMDASGVHEIAPDGAKRLLIRADGDSEIVHVLGRKTSVGRTPDNDLQIDAKFISRHHAVILAAPAHTIIEDLNSTNGVLVNGRRITRQPLNDGDSVVIGKTMFRFAVRPAVERRA